MEIVFEIASTEQHFEEILRLQRQNLFSAHSRPTLLHLRATLQGGLLIADKL